MMTLNNMEEDIISETKFLHKYRKLSWEDAIDKAFSNFSVPDLCRDLYNIYDITESAYKQQLLIKAKKEDI